MQFRLPILDGVCFEYTLDTITDSGLCAVADDIIHGSPSSYLIIHCVDKISICATTIDANISRQASYKYLHALMTSPSCGITKHSVGGNVLVTAMHVARGVLCLSGVADSRLRRDSSIILSGRVERMADDIGRLVEKEALVVGMVRCGGCAFP